MNITILEFNDYKLDISHEFEIMKFKIQKKSDSEEEFESISKILEQYGLKNPNRT